MTSATYIITLAGSLRKESLNKKLARLAKHEAEKLGAESIFIDLADYPLPIFDEDIESRTTPKALIDLRPVFSQASGLFIASPEYNGSFSAALKNTLDWLSRPANEGDYQANFNRLTVALAAASPGSLGGIRGLSQLRELMSNLGSIVLPQQLALGSAYNAFDEHGQLDSAEMRERFDQLIQGLINTSTKLARA